MSRLASGFSEGRVENAMSGYFMNRTPEVKAEIRKLGETLNAIPATKRTELLGVFAKHDPGLCSNAPDWDGIKRSVIFSHRMIPRLRTNFCSGNLTYGDATVADRAITVGSKIIAPGIDPGDPNGVAALASPVILGIEGTPHVTARHPDLAASNNEEGISPYGVVTDIPCSDIDDSGCDPNLGLICGLKVFGPPRCVAYPVVQKDQDLILRGYNFWDVEEAKLLFTPLILGEGTESPAPGDYVVDTNEPIDGAAACPFPTPDNPTHNRAHFRVSANEGHFYRLRMYNHNGHFFTQRDAQDHEDPRILHVCYPESLGETDLPDGTVRDCTLPVETCPDDGAECSVTWNTPPRKLEDCSHNYNEPVVCGDTPEWFASAPLERRSDDVSLGETLSPIVYVINDEPKYEFKATLQAVDCLEETGWDWTGSDEPMLLLAGFSDNISPGQDAQVIENIDESIQAWKGEDFHSNERKTAVQVLHSFDDVAFDDQVLYLLILAEDDDFLGGFLAGAAIIAGVGAIAVLTGGAPLWAAIGGGALLGAGWAVEMASIAESDLLGSAAFTATPLNFDERIASNHAADFLTVSPQLFGALPALEAGPSRGENSPRLVHPFVEDRQRWHGRPLEVECNPGTCQGAQICLVNRCVDQGFVDTTAGVGFMEQRDFSLNGGHYTIDILWEKTQTNP